MKAYSEVHNDLVQSYKCLLGTSSAVIGNSQENSLTLQNLQTLKKCYVFW